MAYSRRYRLEIESARMRYLFCLVAFLCLVGYGAAETNGRASRILTPALAKIILGGPVVQSGPSDSTTGPSWNSAAVYARKGSPGDESSISLSLRHTGSKADAVNVFYLSRATFSGKNVEGLGYPAYRTQAPAQLCLLKGTTLLTITAGTPRVPNFEFQLKIAKAALAKIPND